MPSGEIVTFLELPKVVPPLFWAPVVTDVIVRTPLPPTLSVAFTVTVTLVLFQPLPFGAGEDVAVVVGAVVSFNTTVSVVLPLMPSSVVAVMTLEPPAPPVATPAAVILATPGVPVLHVAWKGWSISSALWKPPL